MHVTATSGRVIWCVNHGAHAESKAAKLKCRCEGKPKRGKGYGGAWGQHRKLLNGVHPRTGEALPPPMRLDGTASEPGVGKYLNLNASAAEVVDELFTVIALRRFDR